MVAHCGFDLHFSDNSDFLINKSPSSLGHAHPSFLNLFKKLWLLMKVSISLVLDKVCLEFSSESFKWDWQLIERLSFNSFGGRVHVWWKCIFISLSGVKWKEPTGTVHWALSNNKISESLRKISLLSDINLPFAMQKHLIDRMSPWCFQTSEIKML